MRIVAMMATYPARVKQAGIAVASILPQVDKLYLVANGCSISDFECVLQKSVEVILPKSDLKDTGKFCKELSPSDYVVCCDDDIIYPTDYVSSLMHVYSEFRGLSPIVGVHGVTYSDMFDGSMACRIVYPFFDSLKEALFVNQLGTGTILCKGAQMPPFSLMESAQGFCDVRFACHCQERGFPRICVARDAFWLKQLPVEHSLFESVSNGWDTSIIREAQLVAGFAKLPYDDLLRSEDA